MKKSEAFPSRFLKAEDLPSDGIVVRIKRIYREAADPEADDHKPKVIAELYPYGQEDTKEWRLNPTNWDLIVDFLRCEDNDAAFIGKEIPIYPALCFFKGDPKTPCIRVAMRPVVYGGDNGDPRISAMLKAFGELNVTRPMLEQRLGIRSIVEITPQQRDSLKALHARMVAGERWPQPEPDLTGWVGRDAGELVVQRGTDW